MSGAMGLDILHFLSQWGLAFWQTLQESAPFLALGLIFAGVLHVLIPANLVSWALGVEGWRGAFRGAIIGTPLPLCSCGVIPTALALRRQGASMSATTAFTISTPETSIDAIAITAAMLPSAFLGVRPIAALLLAFFVGVVVSFFSSSRSDELRTNVLKFSQAKDDCCDTKEICRVCGLMDRESQESHKHGVFSYLKAIFSYSFGTFFQDIATWLMLGLVFAGLLSVLIPDAGFSNTWLGTHAEVQVLVAILAGVPLYSCATATTPMAAVLLAKGADPGAVLALLLAGPATNVGNIFVLRREWGSRTTFVYYASLGVLCYLMGIGFSHLWPLVEKYPELTQVIKVPGLSSGAEGSHWVPHWLEFISAVFLLGLTAHVLLGFFTHKHHAHEGHEH